MSEARTAWCSRRSGLHKRFQRRRALDVHVLQRRRPRRARRRDAGHRRRLGLGQEHAAAPAGRARRADRRQRRAAWASDFAHARRGRAGRLAQPAPRLRLPVPPPAARVQRARQRGDAAAHPPHAEPRGARARARAMLAQVGLAERVQHRPASCRAASASAWRSRARWSTQPACVLADEPTGNLDRDTADGVFALMLRAGARARHGLRDGHARRSAGRALRPRAAADRGPARGLISFGIVERASARAWVRSPSGSRSCDRVSQCVSGPPRPPI